MWSTVRGKNLEDVVRTMPSTDLRRLKHTLERIENERDKLDKLAEHFRGVITYYEKEPSGQPPPLSPAQEMDNTIELILNAHGEALHPRIVYERLLERGIKVPGENPVNNTRSHLSLDDRFEPVGNGLWGLIVWNKQESPASGQHRNGSIGTTDTEGEDYDMPILSVGGPILTDSAAKEFQSREFEELDDLPF